MLPRPQEWEWAWPFSYSLEFWFHAAWPKMYDKKTATFKNNSIWQRILLPNFLRKKIVLYLNRLDVCDLFDCHGLRNFETYWVWKNLYKWNVPFKICDLSVPRKTNFSLSLFLCVPFLCHWKFKEKYFYLPIIFHFQLNLIPFCSVPMLPVEFHRIWI